MASRSFCSACAACIVEAVQDGGKQIDVSGPRRRRNSLEQISSLKTKAFGTFSPQ
jgi:hypothetical protein